MKLNYGLDKNDFLAFQLYTASKSEGIAKKKRNGRLFLMVLFLLIAIYAYWQNHVGLAIYFGVFTLITYLFYGRYFKWRYKKHYQSYIKEHYQQRIGEVVETIFEDAFIVLKDKTGESKINVSELDTVYEIADYFFVKISSGISLIIPKKKVGDANAVRKKLTTLNIPIVQELDWEW